MHYYLDFEQPVAELERRIEDLRRLSDGRDINLTAEIKRLEKKAKELRTEIFSSLTPWQKTLLARHPERPYTEDYIHFLFTDFLEMHGDRRFSDDPAVVAGIGRFEDAPVVVIGHQKGRGTKERIIRNFGQPHPEGYRKALRVMKFAEHFRMPIITFIDTPGAFPGIGAEERGQGEAIATNLLEMSKLKTPIIVVVIGEGGSGGALALGVGDRVFMLEHSVYSVIAPEGCAAILWKKNDREVGPDDYAKAADALKLTAADLRKFGVIDGIIEEPLGGAHRDPKVAADAIAVIIRESLQELIKTPIPNLLDERYARLRAVGSFTERMD